VATELDDLGLDEISLVDEPANKSSRVLLWKRGRRAMKSGGSPDGGGIMDHSEKVGTMRRLMKSLGVGAADLNKAEDDVTNAELVAKIADLEKTNGELTAKTAAAEKVDAARVAVAKTAAEKADRRKATRGKMPAALQAHFDAANDEEKDEYEKAFNGSPDPVVAKVLTATAGQLETVTKENATLRERLDKIEGEQELTKIRAELAPVKGLVDLEKTATLVAKLRKTDPAAAAELVTELKAGAARVEAAGLFKVIGRDSGSVSDADAAIDKATTEVRKAHPEMSEAQAMTVALDANPALYTQHLTEKEAGR
jgi:hypothetical protein